MKSKAITISVFIFALLAACQSDSRGDSRETSRPEAASQPAKRNSGKLIHVLVALCDNQYQAIDGWILNEDGEEIRRRAATAYNQYQKCGMNAALRLFSTGW
ncbi:MAG TPA: hypothetical protein VFY40_28965 [Blastocatellia bacterium]|nr:hypothetical protein [Blastocatellia bacterium]